LLPATNRACHVKLLRAFRDGSIITVVTENLWCQQALITEAKKGKFVLFML
jgi:hypothetical protein